VKVSPVGDVFDNTTNQLDAQPFAH